MKEREGERECEWMGEGQREGETESQAGSMLNTKPNAGLDHTVHEIMPRAEIKSWELNQLSHPGAPPGVSFKASWDILMSYRLYDADDKHGEEINRAENKDANFRKKKKKVLGGLMSVGVYTHIHAYWFQFQLI